MAPPCGNRGRVRAPPEYSDSGAEHQTLRCPPFRATTYCALSEFERKRVNAISSKFLWIWPLDRRAEHSGDRSSATSG